MRIAYVYDCAYPFVKGGGERRIYEVAKRLAEKHEVDWITLKWWENGDKLDADGISYLGVGEWKSIYKNGRRSIGEAIYFALKSLRGIMDNYDVVDCTAFPYFPAITSRFGGIFKKYGLFITWHEVWGDYWYEYLGWKGFFGKVIERMVLKLNAEHIAVSRSTADVLKSCGVEAKVIPNGVDLDYIDSVSPRCAYDLLFVGRLVEEKGVDIFIRLCDELSKHLSFNAGIIGNGPLLQWVEDEVRRRDFIELLTSVGEEEYYSLIKGAKLFILPSKREGFGIAVLESIACGTPVLTIEHPMNFSSEIARMYGYVARNFADMLDFTKKVLDGDFRLEKPDLRDYDWDNIAKKIEEVYFQLSRSE
jgi:glycosyltransferase involved in cell wall biosynthesis